MQDQQTDATSGVPGLSKLPWVGDLFSYKDNDYSKAELIIFIRPTIIERASLQSRELASRSASPIPFPARKFPESGF